jgi:hypothetical protein
MVGMSTPASVGALAERSASAPRPTVEPIADIVLPEVSGAEMRSSS